MAIREIKAEEVTANVKKLFMDCNYYIGEDISNAILKAREEETSDLAKDVLTQLIDNNKIAAEECIPICQDTGMAVLFVEYGDKVVISDGNFEDAVEEGVRQAYTEGYLRKSVVSDPIFDRKNTKDIITIHFMLPFCFRCFWMFSRIHQIIPTMHDADTFNLA